jgi:hypothetical protein
MMEQQGIEGRAFILFENFEVSAKELTVLNKMSDKEFQRIVEIIVTELGETYVE